MRKTTVVFSNDQWNRLSDIAHRERRTPKQQAEFLILRALGWELPPLPTDAGATLAPTGQEPAREGSGAP